MLKVEQFVQEGCNYDAGSSTSVVPAKQTFGDIEVLNSRKEAIVEIITLKGDGCEVIDDGVKTTLSPGQVQTFSNHRGTIKVEANDDLYLKDRGRIVA